MSKKILFPQINGILHGGDYNPEQWLDRPDILEEDIRLMKKAGINSASLGIFSWSTYEPVEGEYHFDWLKNIMDRLYENGIYTVLATPSGARPAWLDEKYPEALRVDSYGMRYHHGVRHNHCMSSPIYREKVSNIVTRLYKAVENHPGLLMWHISNELGGECFCPLCVKKFQDYLADKFNNDINKLNKAWWTTFWSHTYNDFSQIEPPYKNGEYSIMGLNLEWKRFTTYNMTDYMKSEIKLLRELTPNLPVTTNMMQLYDGLDYRVLAKELDVISWDSYPRFHNDYESFADTMAHSAFDHAIMRGLKPDQPFMLMESAPGLVNWHPFNKLKRPGVHNLFSLQAVACGSDTVQYFQWRKGRGSYEQYHGAVIDHLGADDTRVYREVCELGANVSKLSSVVGSIVSSKVCMLFDWDNMWAIDDAMALSQDTKKYPETCIDFYNTFIKLGIDMDIVSSTDNLDKYDVVIAPMLYMLQDNAAENLKSFVERGGELIATYFTGYVDKDTLCFLGGFPGNGLKDVFGIISEEIDTLYPSDRNSIILDNGSEIEVKDYAEVLRVNEAETLGTYGSDYYKATPALTKNSYGKGHAYYIAARTAADDLVPLFKDILNHAGVNYLELPQGIEFHQRKSEDGCFSFYLNNTESQVSFQSESGYNLLTDEFINGTITLPKYGVAIIKN